jgi:hypothetical protein
MSDDVGFTIYLAVMLLTMAVPIAHEAYRVGVEENGWRLDGILAGAALGLTWPFALPVFVVVGFFRWLGRRARRRIDEKQRVAKLLREEGIEP